MNTGKNSNIIGDMVQLHKKKQDLVLKRDGTKLTRNHLKKTITDQKELLRNFLRRTGQTCLAIESDPDSGKQLYLREIISHKVRDISPEKVSECVDRMTKEDIIQAIALLPPKKQAGISILDAFEETLKLMLKNESSDMKRKIEISLIREKGSECLTCHLPPDISAAIRDIRRTERELSELDAPLKEENAILRTERTRLEPQVLSLVTTRGVQVHAKLKPEPGSEPCTKHFWVQKKPPKLGKPVTKLNVSQFHDALDKFATASAPGLKSTAFKPDFHVKYLLEQKHFFSKKMKQIVSEALADVSASKMSKESVSVSNYNPRKHDIY